jgi:hypothetical protein
MVDINYFEVTTLASVSEFHLDASCGRTQAGPSTSRYHNESGSSHFALEVQSGEVWIGSVGTLNSFCNAVPDRLIFPNLRAALENIYDKLVLNVGTCFSTAWFRSISLLFPFAF